MAYEVIQGTTPTITVNTGVDLSGWDPYITFEHARGRIVKSGDEVTVDGTKVSVLLSQEETLSFPAGRRVEVQVRAINGESVVRSTKTKDKDKCTFLVLECLDRRILEVD